MNNDEYLRLMNEQSRLIGLLSTNPPPPNSAEIRNRLTNITVQLHSYSNPNSSNFNPNSSNFNPNFNPYTPPPLYTHTYEGPSYNSDDSVNNKPPNILYNIFRIINDFFPQEIQSPTGLPPWTDRPPPRTNVPPTGPPPVDPNQIHYDVFNEYCKTQKIPLIHISSDKSTITKAYRKLVLKYHPDKGGNNEDFSKIDNAYKSILELRVNGGAQKQRRKTKKIINRKKTI